MTKTYKPFIKWVWGKRQLLSQLESLYPKKFNNYFEPFVGWGAVFFDLRNKYWNSFKATLFDINQELVNVYNVIKNDPSKLIDKLRKYKYDKDQFLEIRSRDLDSNFTIKRSDVERASRFIYLNRTWFNGLYRVNKKGHYNVPFGTYNNPMICDKDNLLLAHEALKNTVIRTWDFETIIKHAKKGDFVYFDPPYDVLTGTANFTGYAKWWFGRDEQVRLFEAYKALDKKWCFVMLSNHNTPFINELYKEYRKEVVLARRSVNSNSNKRGKVEETVILNY